MRKVTFLLKDFPANDFAHWLEYHTSPRLAHIKHGQGKIFCRGAKFPGDITGPTRIDMGVYYIDPDRDETAYAAVLSGEVDETPSLDPPRRRLRDVFYFDVVPIGPDTEVTVWCGVPELMEYCRELLKEIAKLREEAAEQIERALGTPTPQTPAEDGAGHDRQMIRTASAMTLTLFLNTTPSLFAQWLADYTRGIHLREFPTESGRYYSLQPVWPPHQIVGPTALDMDGFYHTLPSESEEAERAHPIPRLIRFKIVPLTSERIEVMLECKLPEVMDYFNELLEKMRQRWPEAAEQPGTPIPPQKMTPFAKHQVIVKKSKGFMGYSQEAKGAV